MTEHDRLCPARHHKTWIPAECTWCALLTRARLEAAKESFTRVFPQVEQVQTWACLECGNIYDYGVRYCPNGLQDRHRLTIANETGEINERPS